MKSLDAWPLTKMIGSVSCRTQFALEMRHMCDKHTANIRVKAFAFNSKLLVGLRHA